MATSGQDSSGHERRTLSRSSCRAGQEAVAQRLHTAKHSAARTAEFGSSNVATSVVANCWSPKHSFAVASEHRPMTLSTCTAPQHSDCAHHTEHSSGVQVAAVEVGAPGGTPSHTGC